MEIVSCSFNAAKAFREEVRAGGWEHKVYDVDMGDQHSSTTNPRDMLVIIQSTTLVQPDIHQQLYDGLP